MERPNVALIGLGALGILYGQKLQQGLPQGSFKVIAGTERAARYRKNGVRCNGEACDFDYVAPGEGGPADLVIVAVKATGLAAAMEDMQSQIGPETVIFSVLNGISSEQELAAAFGPEKVLYAVAQGMDATRTGQELFYKNMGVLLLGEKDGQLTPRLARVAALLEGCGIQCQQVTDILRLQWKKLMLNVGVNQATALFETGYGGVQVPGPARDTMIAAMNEVIPVAASQGVALTQADIDYWLELAATFAPEGMTSMRQDMLAKRPTEVELFAGTILRLGQAAGVPTPVNQAIYEQVRAVEAGWK